VSVYLLVTGIVLGRLRPGSVLDPLDCPLRRAAPDRRISARGLTEGFAVPMMGIIVVALVIADRRVVVAPCGQLDEGTD
jgi:hypothetical protein